MNSEVIITCAVTGAGDTTGRSDKVPVTPEQIADAAIEAAKGWCGDCTYSCARPENRSGVERCGSVQGNGGACEGK